MGQYYKIVNLDKQQFLCPWAFGHGAKLLEFGCDSDGIMTALAVLLAPASAQGGRGGGDFHYDAEALVGSWGGDHIVIAGDYAEPSDRAGWDTEHDCTIYASCSEGRYADISSVVLQLLRQDQYLAEHLPKEVNA